MPVTNDVYDQLKIDKLKHFLEAQAERGQAKPFEIFVDNLKVVSKTSSIYTIKPTIIDIGGDPYAKMDTLTQESLVFQVQKVQGQTLSLGIKESDSILQYVTLKAYKFPYINLLWLGTIIMVLGFLISMARRMETNKIKKRTISGVRREEQVEISEVK